MAGPLFVESLGHDCIEIPAAGQTQINTLKVEDTNDTTIDIKLCRFGDGDWRIQPAGSVFIPTGYTLYTLILDSDDGETMFAFTHVLKDALLNVHVEPHQKFVKVGDSGLEPFTMNGQNPAHIHLAIMKDRQQYGRWTGGMGNIRPWDWLIANGFMIRNEGSVPSPNQYIQGYVNSKPY